MMAKIGAAVALGRSGQRAEARETLAALWAQAGDAFQRCTIAHYLADLQETTEAELGWDERALAAVAGRIDERAEQYPHAPQVRAFLPSLHLNLADCHRRLGDTERAHQHLATAREFLDALPDDGYGELMRDAIRHVTDALAAGSTEPLASHPR
ncbi:hypothetical protein [Plantactinospora sp. GCM10030261]|uniref:hypothetical protein n=1 Tax=Plantactinospora sp. GCM10030261 TaxID=3273420 RepID=UPI00360D0621